MRRRLVWSDKARQDFREIIAYIADHNPRAAGSVAQRIEQTAINPATAPTGRQGRVTDTYEKILSGLPYIIADTLEATPGGQETLTVLRVIHGARDWPEGQWP